MTSYFQDIEHHIVKQICLAENRLLIAVAWFTNQTIGDEILKKKNLDIEIVVDDNLTNHNCGNLLKLKSENIDIAFVKDLNKNYYLMHNKFCVIDNTLVITGSYNWTKNANTNDENITIVSDKTTAAQYAQEFRRIKAIKFPNENIAVTEAESNEITNLIYIDFVQLLRDGFKNGEPKSKLFYSWTNTKLQNKIRTINEQLRNTTHKKVGNFGIYSNLIQKYGIEYKALSTEAERVQARDIFQKKGLNEVEFYVEQQFKFFKVKAIKKLIDNYIKLMDTSKNDSIKVEKVLKVFMFLTEEKKAIVKDLNMNIF